MARRIRAVWLPAGAQEARLTGASPLAHAAPLLQEIQASPLCWLGALDRGSLAGALAFGPDDEPGQYLVNALVVHPARQRRGLARALLGEALRLGGGHVFAVSTGEANAPALALYRGLGFVPYRRGSTGPGAPPMLKLRRPALG